MDEKEKKKARELSIMIADGNLLSSAGELKSVDPRVRFLHEYAEQEFAGLVDGLLKLLENESDEKYAEYIAYGEAYNNCLKQRQKHLDTETSLGAMAALLVAIRAGSETVEEVNVINEDVLNRFPPHMRDTASKLFEELSSPFVDQGSLTRLLDELTEDILDEMAGRDWRQLPVFPQYPE